MLKINDNCFIKGKYYCQLFPSLINNIFEMGGPGIFRKGNYVPYRSSGFFSLTKKRMLFHFRNFLDEYKEY